MKAEFKGKLDKILNRKKTNSIYFINNERYQDFISEVNIIKNKWKKDYDDYKMLASYDVLEVNGKLKLIKPRDEASPSIKFYVVIDELFGVLHTMHLLFNHAGLDVLEAELKTKYCNISKEVIKIYLSCCVVCRDKKVKFMISRDGEMLMKLGDFTFTRESSSGDRGRWSCYTHSNNCPAKVYTKRSKILFAKNHHNHPPTEFFV